MIKQTVEATVKYFGPYDGGIADILQKVGELGLLGKARKAEDYRLLYVLAQTLGGPVLEQGASYGLSTRCIIRGLSTHKQQPPFQVYSVDLNHQWDKHDLPPVYDPSRVAIDGDSTAYAPPEPCVWGFEDAKHDYETTRMNLQRQIGAGCHTILIHDTAERLQGWKCGDIIWDCRRAVMDILGDWDLIDIESDSGMILAQRKDDNEQRA